MSIKGKLIMIFLALSLIPMAIITFYSTNQTEVALTDSAKLYLQSKVEAFNLVVQQEIGDRNLTAFLKKAVMKSLSKKAEEEKYFDEGYMTLLNSSGEVLYHPNKDLMGKFLIEEPYVQDAFEQLSEGGGFYPYSTNGQKKMSWLAKNDDLDLIMWAVVPEAEILSAVSLLRNKLNWFILAVALIVTSIALLFANSISKPIKNLADNITYIAENLDLTALDMGRFLKRKDEIGSLSGSFDSMLGNWKEVLSNISEVARNLLSSSAQLAEASEDSSAASEEVSASIEEVANRASDQTNYLNQTNQAVTELISKLNNSSQLGEEAYQLAHSTLEQASQGQSSVTNVISQMNSINHVIEEISNVVNNLVYKSNQIGEIVNLIDSIANQTQLLALNAAIEAARAGEAGRGFSVVADEIKQLAEESMKSANKIKEIIEETQKESKKASAAMELGKKEVKSGSEVVDDAGELFKIIIDASETNLNGTKETMISLGEAIKIADSIIDKVHEVAGIAEETSASAEEVSASTEEQTATMEQVSASASLLKEMAVEIEKMIGQFKLES